MRPDTWQKLEEMFAKHPVMKAEPVSYEEIDACADHVGFPVHPDFREFVHRYGGAIVGPFPVFGLRKAKPMGNGEESFVAITDQFRRQRWPGVEKWAVISMDHAGNPFGLDENGKVWISDHDARAVQVIANTFEEYLRKWCLKLRD